MRILRYILSAILAVGMVSCEKELDFDYHDIEPLTVIEGTVDGNGAEIKITMTTPMSEPMDREPLTDASVVLRDVSSSQSWTLLPDNNGCFSGGEPGITGHTYELLVERGESSWRSVSTMLPSVEIFAMEFQWIKMPYDYVAVLQISFSDDSTRNGDCYWCRIYRNGEAYLWTAIDDILAVDGRIDEVVMTSRKDLEEEEDDRILRDGDVVSVKVSRISKEMHDYLEAISNGTSNIPQMFSGDLCLGYFLASPVAEMSVVFHPDELTEFK